MTSLDRNKILVGMVLAGILILPGCGQDNVAELDEPVLRVHDVSHLQVEELDGKINELLSREDLPLRGRVELLDENRMAVNASRYVQDELSAMIEQLHEAGSEETIERPFMIQYWLLRMAKAEGSGDVPDFVMSDLSSLLERFEGYSLSVEDYLETHHAATARMGPVVSGRGARVFVRNAEATEKGVSFQASVQSRGESSRIDFQVNHMLEPGRALVLGKAHDGGEGDQASYQVLVARAEWTDTAD